MAQLELPGFDETALTLKTGLTWSLSSVSRSCRLYVSEPDPDGVTWFCYSGRRLDHDTRMAMLDLARSGPVKHFVDRDPRRGLA